MTCGIHYDPFLENHRTGRGHPEKSNRSTHVYENLRKSGLLENTQTLNIRSGTEEELLLVHEMDYLRRAKFEIKNQFSTLSSGDTQICQLSWEVALRATGGVLQAVDHVFKKTNNRAFCLTRPPGHHATPGKGMGFCIFNHVAIAARYAQNNFGVGKILIVDWDVHHGNGTQETFYDDDTVLFLSTHQSPWYPGTGSENETGRKNGLGYTLNFPFPAGTGRKDIVDKVFGEELPRKVAEFKPELILISAGFDSREGDPLGNFYLQDEDFSDLTKIIVELAEEHCHGRVVSTLEGGYSLEGLASASLAHLSSMVYRL